MQFNSIPNRYPKTLPPKAFLSEIPEGEAGVAAPLKAMRPIVKAHGKVSPLIRSLAVELTRHLPQKDWAGEIRALHRFVRDKIRYVRDVRDVETLHFPEIVLQQGSGDCDDKAILLASLLESINHPARFVAIGFQPGNFEHVYVETMIGNSWIPLETTEPVEIGWQPKNIQARKVVHI